MSPSKRSVASQRVVAGSPDHPHSPEDPSFEFFGPHVPGVLVFALPAVLYGLILGCHRDGCLRLGMTTPSGMTPFVKLPDKGARGWRLSGQHIFDIRYICSGDLDAGH